MNLPRRLFKQVLYGGSFLAGVLFIAILLLVILLRKPPTCGDGAQNQGEGGVDCGGPCALSCEVKALKPPSLSNVFFFEGEGGRVITFFEARNFSPSYAAELFPYALQFYNARGETTLSLDREAFIYAGQIKTVVDVDIPLSFQEVARVTAVPREGIVWKPREEFERPRTDVREFYLNYDGSSRTVTIRGLAVNRNPFAVSRISVVVLFYNELGSSVLRVGKTQLNNFSALEEREFQFTFHDIDQDAVREEQVKLFLEAER